MKKVIFRVRSAPYLRFISMFIILSLFIQLGIAVNNAVSAHNIRVAPTSNYFVYSTLCNDGRNRPVQYEGTSKDGDGKWRINTSSCSWFKQKYPVTFVDRLYCKGGDGVYSLENSTTDAIKVSRVTTYYTVKRWFYADPFPSGSTCYIQSTITMHVEGIDKSQDTSTLEFKPTQGSA